MSSDGDSDAGGSDETCSKDVPKFSPEERAVLLQCRRQSMLRGLVAGGGLCLAIYWFKAQGRVPSFITRFPGLTYTMGFFAAFSSGAGSYQKTCLKKLMALENSVIADSYRKAIEKNGKGTSVNTPSKPDRAAPSPFPSSMPKPRAQTSPQAPNVQLNEGPAINMSTYARDKAVLEARTDEEEQPSAFSAAGVEDRQSPGALGGPPPQEDSGKRRRTFNEIREENRQKHSQPPNHSPSQSGSRSGSGKERKKLNKYGDAIE